MKQNRIITSALIILTFLFSLYGNKVLSHYVNVPNSSEFVKTIYGYLWWIIPPVIVTGILFGFKNVLKELGIDKGVVTGVVFAIVTVSPMLVSSAFIGQISSNLHIESLVHKTVLAGTMEEFLFRGFLFGLLYRKIKWGFIPATILGAFLFGFGHIYQGSTFNETIGIFLVTSFGAIWFSWLFIEWNDNLWVPVFLHIFMNLSWILFDVSANAGGGLYTNIFRVITIALTIIITIYYNKKNGLKINRKNLLLNNS